MDLAPMAIMEYELLDFGGGRKLERFGEWVLDRPSPGAEGPPAHEELWKSATSRYTGARTTEGTWRPAVKKWPRSTALFPVCLVEERQFELLLSPLPSGQVGVFPEQFENWRWIARQSA